jgi:two-component system, OmpR family, response regulator
MRRFRRGQIVSSPRCYARAIPAILLGKINRSVVPRWRRPGHARAASASIARVGLVWWPKQYHATGRSAVPIQTFHRPLSRRRHEIESAAAITGAGRHAARLGRTVYPIVCSGLPRGPFFRSMRFTLPGVSTQGMQNGSHALPIFASASIEEGNTSMMPDEHGSPKLRKSDRILFVHHDPTRRLAVANYLSNAGMRVSSSSSVDQMMDALAAQELDLMIFELRQGDGMDPLRGIRSHCNVPIMITSEHSDEADRVVALELGADDYITTPFGLIELLARVRAILRRYRSGSAPYPAKLDRSTYFRKRDLGSFRFGQWRIDRRRRMVTGPDGKTVDLTRGEYNLLNVFIDKPQQCLNREHLSRAADGRDDHSYRSVAVRVMRLRRKLQSDPAASPVILTEPGVGYSFALPVSRIVMSSR